MRRKRGDKFGIKRYSVFAVGSLFGQYSIFHILTDVFCLLTLSFGNIVKINIFFQKRNRGGFYRCSLSETNNSNYVLTSI